MADNEIRADIKINVESNAKEAVSEIKSEFSALEAELNSIKDNTVNQVISDNVINNIDIVNDKAKELSDTLSNIGVADIEVSNTDEAVSQFNSLDAVFDDLVDKFSSGELALPDDIANKAEEAANQFKFLDDIIDNLVAQYSVMTFDIDMSGATDSLDIMNEDLVMFEEKVPDIIEELGLAQKPAQEIADSLELASKYAMDISNMKVPDNDTSWLGNNNNEGASYDIQIPTISSQQTEEVIEQTSKLKDLFSGLGESASGASSIIGGELTGALSDMLPALGTGAALLGGIKFAINEAKEAMNDLITIAKSAGTALADAFNNAINALNKLINKLEQTAKKIKALADQGVNLQKKWFTAYNYLGAQTGTEITNFLGDMEQIYGLDGDNLIGSLREISVLVGNLGLDAENSSKAVKELMIQGLDISAYTGMDYDSVINSLQSAVNMGFIGRSSPLIKALGLTKEDVATFRQLNNEADRLNFILSKSEHVRGTYEKWLNTSAGRVERLNNSLSRLQGNTQRLALNLWAKVAPVIIKLIDLVNELVSGLAKLLNIDLTSAEANLADTGYIFDGLSEGIGGVSDNLDKTADSLDRTADSADEAKKHLASFDDVIQINDDTSSKMDDELEGLGGSEDFGGSVGLAEALGNFDFGALAGDIEEAKGELQEFFDLLKAGNYYGAGTWIGNYITDKLNSIDWDNIKNKAGEIATNLAAFLNGIFNNKELFKAIGKTIAEALNTGIRFIADFAGNLNWRSVGTALSQSWKSFWYNFDSAELGRALYNVIHGVFEAFWGFLGDMWETDEAGYNGWQLAGMKIADVLNTFFNSWTLTDVKDAARSIISFIDGVFEMLGTFIRELNTEDIKEKFRAFIHELFMGFYIHADDWAKTLSEFIDFIIDMIDILIEEWDSTQMTDTIIKFLEDSHIIDLVAKWMELKAKIWWEKFQIKAAVVVEALFKLIGDKVKEGILKILGWLAAIPLLIIGGAMQLGVEISEWLEWLHGVIKDWFSDRIEGLKEKMSLLVETLGTLWGTIWDTITSKWEGFWETWSLGIDSLEEGWSGFCETIEGIWNTFQENWGLGVDSIREGWSGFCETAGGIWDTFQENWGLGVDSIREGWSTFCDTISGIWDTIWGKIEGVFEGVKNFILGGIETISGALTGLLDKLHEVPIVGSAMDGIAGFTGNILGKIDIPFLADGGIVSRATPAIVGEAGKEAVIPLENNTGWMDILANKTAQRLGGVTQSNNQTVVIDMSKSVKPVYSRSEMVAFGRQVAEALKVYGVQVSVNT